ncbi:hypothetical protein C7212DRAFT_184682 [Tuber magnatum]|uniref:Uncharacterized protein n=1 Tax=Tuber magnatum TaxID=42249 RepID=A0A317STI7_9PEZI|nr:hypothetical protein C7212DRAFT_184682 [Tuber magnatum]
MNLSAADLQIIRRHSIQSLRRNYRQIFGSSTGLEVKDVQEKPEILNSMLKGAATRETPDYRSLVRTLLDLLASSTACQELRYPDSSNRSTQQRILLFAEEWPKQLDMDINALGLCKDVLMKALSPDTDVPDADLWRSVYCLLRTLHFSDLDLRVIEESSLQDFLITYRERFRTSHPKFFFRTAGLAMDLRRRARVLGSLLEEAIREGQFNNMFFVFLQQLALTGASAELRHPIGTDTSVRQQILLFSEEWPYQLAASGDTFALCKDAILKALTAGLDKEFWYCMYKLLDSFHFSGIELGKIQGNRLQAFRSNYRLLFLERSETTIERVIENPEILKSMLKNTSVHEPLACCELFRAFLRRLALTNASGELRHPIGSGTPVRQRIMLVADEWPSQLVLNDKALDLCVDVLFKALIHEADGSDRELWYSVYHLLNALHFSSLDLQLIRETPLRSFRRTYRRFFLEESSLTINQVLENPATLRSMLVESKGGSLKLPLKGPGMEPQTTGSGSRELFHVFLCQLALTEVSGELKHPIGSDTTVGKRLLLFAGEWPNQITLSGDALGLCTDLLIKALSPEEEISDIEFWYSVYHLLNAFPAAESERANRNIAVMVKDYAVKYAKEHPYLLALNVGLTVVGFAIPPFLGVLGFTRAGVGAGVSPPRFGGHGWRVSYLFPFADLSVARV